MHVRIKWGDCLSSPVLRGTRQGGLSSPFLFNLFYEDLVSTLNAQACGVRIAGNNFNVHCYADDLLLVSTSTSGLQHLIDAAVSYIADHGLRFNPAKSLCMVYGEASSTLSPQPRWTIDGENIPITEDGMCYLGAILSRNGSAHAEKRMKSTMKAFYGLQGAGLHLHGLAPHVSARLYDVGVRTVLTYGCGSVHIDSKAMRKMESTQRTTRESLPWPTAPFPNLSAHRSAPH
jgi:hypothetical protein